MSRKLDSRYQRKPSAISRGYAPNSIMATLSEAERKEVQAKLVKARRDSIAYERQLERGWTG
jgi:hypothetical protein